MNSTVLLSDILHVGLLHLLIFIISDKNGKSLYQSCKSLRYSISTWRTYPLSLSLW